MAPETLSDGVSARLHVHACRRKPSRALALGPGVARHRTASGMSLAEHGAADLDQTVVRVVRAEAARVEVEVVYTGRLKGGATAVREIVVGFAARSSRFGTRSKAR